MPANLTLLLFFGSGGDRVEAVRPNRRLVIERLREVSAGEDRVLEPRAAQVGRAQLGVGKVGTIECRVVELGAAEVGALQRGAGQVGADELA
jgi:hypothetical protein